MKTINGKNKGERMINKPLKYMGLVVQDASSNKHMYAEVTGGDFDRFAYYQIFETPRHFTQQTPTGKEINKVCFHIDNYDDGKGHDAIFLPEWMMLKLINGNITQGDGYLVAIERNKYNVNIINALNALNDGCDSIKVLTPETIKGLTYHY